MKSIELLAIGIRLVGIYTLILTFRSVSYAFNAYHQYIATFQEDASVLVFVSTAQVIILLIAAFMMLKFPLLLSKWLLPKTSEGDVILHGNSQDVQSALFCVLGVYILSWAVPDFFDNAIWWYSAQSDRLHDGASDRYLISEVITVLEIGIGLCLTLKANGLSHLLYRLRTAGVK